MKTPAPPRLRYRPPEHWPLYYAFKPYAPPKKKHTYIRVGTPGDFTWVCVDCGTTEIRA